MKSIFYILTSFDAPFPDCFYFIIKIQQLKPLIMSSFCAYFYSKKINKMTHVSIFHTKQL